MDAVLCCVVCMYVWLDGYPVGWRIGIEGGNVYSIGKREIGVEWIAKCIFA